MTIDSEATKKISEDLCRAFDGGIARLVLMCTRTPSSRDNFIDRLRRQIEKTNAWSTNYENLCASRLISTRPLTKVASKIVGSEK